jgi:hypothetical protein
LVLKSWDPEKIGSKKKGVTNRGVRVWEIFFVIPNEKKQPVLSFLQIKNKVGNETLYF